MNQFTRFALLSLTCLCAACSAEKGAPGMRTGGGAAASAKPDSGQLAVDISIPEARLSAGLDDAVETEVLLTFTRQTDQPLQGTAVLRSARELDTFMRPQVFAFDLRDTRSQTIPAKITIPAGLGVVQLTYPLEVLVDGRPYLDMDFMLTKGRAWRVIGPFAGGPAESFDTAYPPEQAVDLAASYEGKGGRTLRWRPFGANDIWTNGFFDLNSACADVDLATGYAALTIPAPEPTEARLLLGADDSVKVWLNGEQIYQDYALDHSAEPGQAQVDIALKRGDNTLLLKVCDHGGGWGYFFDLVDRDGNPLDWADKQISLARVYPTDAHFRITDVTRTSASVSWRSDVPKTGRVIVREAIPGRAKPYAGPLPRTDMIKPAPGGKTFVVETDDLTMNHTATIDGLSPGKRYLVQVDSAIGAAPTEPLTFYTDAPEGQTQVLTLKVACVIFTNAAENESAEHDGAQQPVGEDMIDHLKWQLDQTRRFYFVNTGMRLCLDIEYFVDDRFYAISKQDIYGVGHSEHNAGQQLLFDVLERNSRSFDEFDGLAMTTFTKRWEDNDRGGRWIFTHGGGGTLGVMTETGLSRCTWRSSDQSNDAWLMCHEFHHQVDALYHSSGQPDLLFCHFQPWDDTAHLHGEHWDGIAWTFREWAGYVTREHQGWPLLEPTKGYRYFTCRWGTVEQFADADNDGVPDNAPELPLDEQRFGSSPQLADTDGDGLSDEAEVMASEWVEYGHGYHWAGTHEMHRCDPRNPDTDGDGVPDGEDPYPLYASSPEIHRAPNAHGKIALESLQPLTTIDDPVFSGRYFVGWNEDYLSIAMRSPKVPYRMRWCLDNDNDGWFVGGDNYDFQIVPSEDARAWGAWQITDDKLLSYAFHNCGVPGKWPFYDEAGSAELAVTAEQHKADDGYWVQLHIARNPAQGLDLAPGEEVGIMLTVDPGVESDRPGNMRSLSVFEPHRFFAMQLVPATDGGMTQRDR